MPSADRLRDLAAAELVQLAQEGCQTGDLQALYDQAAEQKPARMLATLEQLFDIAAQREPAPGYAYEEPSDADAIATARPDGPRQLEVSPEQAKDRIAGAWLGRCAGCMLGKPVEGWSRDDIRTLLQFAGEYPLSDYFPPLNDPPESLRAYHSPGNTCLRGNIAFSERDDDTDYTLLGLHIMETYGPEFTSANVGAEWLGRLPYHRVYTAEREAYRNLVNDIMPPQSARTMNPYREWIGAQIRCDGFAYCAPGWPEMAAKFAFRDAAVSHVKNGIYGEMFFAALIAACMALDDLHEAIAIARSEIPDSCRLAEAIDDAVTWCAQDTDWSQTWDKMDTKYGHYHPVHTINNAVIVLMGCLHADGDLGKAICISVMCGLDTDCNGATAGSLMGALLGRSGVANNWVAPLNDELHSALEGMNVSSISDLAERTFKVARGVRFDT